MHNNRIELNVKCYAHEANGTERDAQTKNKKRQRETNRNIQRNFKSSKGQKRRRRTLNLNDSEEISNYIVTFDLGFFSSLRERSLSSS